MKVNNVALTKHNLAEMVADWEKELTQAMDADKANRVAEAQDKLNRLRTRMLYVVIGCR